MGRLKNKRGRKSNYVKSLNNDNHREAKRKALIRDKFMCKLCTNRIYLEYHHISYHVLGKELKGDNLKWTVILCENHHQEVHNNLNHEWNPKNPHKKSL
jgi:5-methylcytosine-specific restriction endonuclease McrA